MVFAWHLEDSTGAGDPATLTLGIAGHLLCSAPGPRHCCRIGPVSNTCYAVSLMLPAAGLACQIDSFGHVSAGKPFVALSCHSLIRCDIAPREWPCCRQEMAELFGIGGPTWSVVRREVLEIRCRRDPNEAGCRDHPGFKSSSAVQRLVAHGSLGSCQLPRRRESSLETDSERGRLLLERRGAGQLGQRRGRDLILTVARTPGERILISTTMAWVRFTRPTACCAARSASSGLHLDVGARGLLATERLASDELKRNRAQADSGGTIGP